MDGMNPKMRGHMEALKQIRQMAGQAMGQRMRSKFAPPPASMPAAPMEHHEDDDAARLLELAAQEQA